MVRTYRHLVARAARPCGLSFWLFFPPRPCRSPHLKVHAPNCGARHQSLTFAFCPHWVPAMASLVFCCEPTFTPQSPTLGGASSRYGSYGFGSKELVIKSKPIAAFSSPPLPTKLAAAASRPVGQLATTTCLSDPHTRHVVGVQVQINQQWTRALVDRFFHQFKILLCAKIDARST